PASIAMITAAGLNVAKVALVNLEAFAATHAVTDLFLWKAIVLAVLLFAGQRLFPKVHPVLFIAASAAVGVVFRFAGV
ncbi:MAG: chromate transporter, partial [Lachnospiraceae bacterium]|nr:chromate transporter [Lachnospiraceae bacterium]